MTRVSVSRIEDVYSVPPGVILGEGGSNHFFINDEGTITNTNGDVWDARQMVGYNYEVPENPFTRRRETFDEFRQRLCIMARGFQRDHGVDAEPVYDLLRRFDCWFEGEAEPGMWVYNNDDHLRPPSDRVLTLGVRADWDHYGVFTPEWRHLFGGLTRARFARVDGPFPTPTERDAEQIRALKVRVWEAGVRAKSRQSWCGAFERMVGAMRIDANVNRVRVTAPVDPTVTEGPADLGRHVPAREQAAYAPGTIFRWGVVERDGGERWNWCVRDDTNITNEARTRNLIGPNRGQYSGSGSYLVHDGSQPMWIAVPNTDAGRILMDALPIGTHVGTSQDRDTCMSGVGHLYKHANGWHSSPTGHHGALETGHVLREWPIHIMEMPGVPGAEPSQGPAAFDF